MNRSTLLVLLGTLLLGCAACSNDASTPPLFTRLSPERTGVTFSNTLTESPSLNILNYLYYYNGGGVAVGDLNGDRLPDLYFTANEGPNKLYLNQGDFRFKDVTKAAGVAGSADWSTGVTMADVNGDGRLDIYVSVVHGIQGLEGHNELYINQGPGDDGVPQFTENAAQYGLDQRAYGTQATFFDYDDDGDLDVYLLNSSTHEERTYGRAELRKKGSEKAGDRLYRNDDSSFVEVTEEAGLYSGRTGYGLGVAVSDLDRNGCPDLYVANDFHEHDYLYYNNCDGTFTEAIEQATGHVSYSSMGVDAADYNNDGRPDVAVLDMLPFQEKVRKTSAGADTREVYELKRRYGYHHQLDRNTLQLNQGNRRFSEIGLLAGVAATDWSWAPLFADLNNDGRKDLFVTNGIYRRPNDLDYIEYASQDKVIRKMKEISEEDLKIQERLPQRPVSNFAFHNDGDLTFSDSTTAWGLHRPGFSNGAAYADLNNDGSLDLITNNIEEPASIYENRADSLLEHHALTIRLRGDGENTRGIGATVTVHQENRTQVLEQMPTRGYQSSVAQRLHFGLGTQDVDSLTVVWPDGRTETRANVAVDQTITLHQADATAPAPAPDTASNSPLVTTAPADTLGIDFQHEENTAYDFRREPLMPHKLSQEGPAVAVGDVNGDGLDDVYLGGAKRQPGALYVQEQNGRFHPSDANKKAWRADKLHEDVDAAFFDANGDGALDLYVVSAGNEFWGDADALRDRLYLNDGSGTFRRADGALPGSVATNGGVVAPADFDDDGDMDLFVGSRVVARKYGKTPESALLENDGSGHFTDVTDEVGPGLRKVGMVSDAAWTDVRGSDALDLVVVGEWMPITVFEQQEGELVDRTDAAGLADTHGWWNAVHAADLNGDGTDDLIAGNLSLNSRLRATPDAPARLYRNDFGGKKGQESILTHYRHGTSYPYAGRDALLEQIPSLKKKFPTYESFGASQIDDLFSAAKIREATVKTAHTFASVYVEHQGDGTFAVEALPSRAQFAPIYGTLVHDLDDNGTRDVMLGGNFYALKPKQGRYDASYGTVLRGDGNGRWTPVPPPESNLYLRGEVRALRLLERADGTHCVLVARNDARPQVVRLQETDAP
ncbi:MAG: VCBS repeat-containing protein [Salinibacter sp.]|uniref:VCBS repeat-containing protein n=1 Tax=Salinibacter sp. TaxID=2065818 RepID=UPI0035D4734E